MLIGPIALIALLIGPPELAAILFLSVLIISSTSNGSVGKNMIMLAVGLLLALIGQDPIGALSRFTFDIFELRAGIPLLPMLIGLFAIPEILLNIENKSKDFIKTKLNLKKEEKLTWNEFKKLRRTIFRSTVIGTTIGMIPGVGQVVAAFVGYAAAKNASKDEEMKKKIESKNEFDALLYQSKSVLDNQALTEEDKTAVREKLEEMQQWFDENPNADFDTKKQELQQFIMQYSMKTAQQE